MIARLTGTVHRLGLQEALVDVQGVGYNIHVPPDAWDHLQDGDSCTVWISTYVREDRLELYGFTEQSGKVLFEYLIAQSGIGPKMGLELCAVPRELLAKAIQDQDTDLLGTVKGIGKKKAEKILLELKRVLEKEPNLFATGDGTVGVAGALDEDALSALTTLGYDTSTVLSVLKDLPSDLETTEERVTAALRSL